MQKVKENFPVLEMTCAACAVSVESMLRSTPGVLAAGVNFANHSAWVEYDRETVSPQDLQATVRSIGYDIIIEDRDVKEEEARQAHYRSVRHRAICASILSLPVLVIGMFFMHMPYASWVMLILSTPVVTWFGRDFFIHAWKQALHRKANMDTLVAISTGTAWLFSVFNTIAPGFWLQRGSEPHVYFEAAAVVIAFVSLGKWLEEGARVKTSSAIRKLIGLQPKTAAVVRDGLTTEVPLRDIHSGDIVLIRPGERIPVDGTIETGESYIDESTITGEPIPAQRSKGDNVYAGTLNGKSSLNIRVQHAAADTLLSRIIRKVQEAQGSKAPVQRLVDKISGIFVPVVIGISILSFLAWWLAGGPHAISQGLLAAVTVLVIACPCALGLATPTAIMVGIGKGAQHHILVRDAETLEIARHLDAIVLDKTGTMTMGKPRVAAWINAPGEDEATLKSIVLALEWQSEHPLGRAVIDHLGDVKPVNISGFQSITGKGISGRYNGDLYLIGNIALLKEYHIDLTSEWEQSFQSHESQARTVVAIARNQSIVGLIAIEDQVKPGSPEAIQELSSLGLDIYMLTGDNVRTAAAVAEKAGIKKFQAGMLPAEKAGFIRFLQTQGKKVAMVGDGINDSEALAQADCSIAMASGSDIAIEVAQVTLMHSDLRGLGQMIRLSRKTSRTIRQNLFWAFIYNVIGIPVAAGALYPFTGFLLSPMVAGAAMALSSLSVVGNSLRLRAAKI